MNNFKPRPIKASDYRDQSKYRDGILRHHLTKDSKDKKTRVYSWIAFCRKMRVKNRTKSRVWQDSSLCQETSTKNSVQEFHLCICTGMDSSICIKPWHLDTGPRLLLNPDRVPESSWLKLKIIEKSVHVLKQKKWHTFSADSKTSLPLQS